MTGLYFHIPFCRRKCPYCDFFSIAADPASLAAYPGLLRRQMELSAGEWKGPLQTVFFGGGTPSLLPPAAVEELLEEADRIFGLAPQAEISLEANPGTVTPASLAGYRAAGVNRLSLGIQSLNDANLGRLGRLHTAGSARSAVRWAREAGFANLACDLMFALPGQELNDLQTEIAAFLDLGAEHLSCYGLSVEEGTPFHHLHRAGGLELPGEEKYRDFYLELHETLTAAGYDHYEISNYARPEAACRHNLNYWRRIPYLGVGAGAHSLATRGWGERWATPSDLEAYARAVAKGENPAERLEAFDRQGAMAETLYLGLRTAEGVAEEEFCRRFGIGVAEAFPAPLAHCRGRLRQVDGRWRFDLEGWLLYDYLIASFL